MRLKNSFYGAFFSCDWKLYSVTLLTLLAIVIGFLYSPIFNANFQGDDFGIVKYMYFNFQSFLTVDGMRVWLASLPYLPFLPYFRPVLQLFYIVDYTAWGLSPLGYHITSLTLHLLTSFLVFVLAWQLTRERLAAAISVCSLPSCRFTLKPFRGSPRTPTDLARFGISLPLCFLFSFASAGEPSFW